MKKIILINLIFMFSFICVSCNNHSTQPLSSSTENIATENLTPKTTQASTLTYEGIEPGKYFLSDLQIEKERNCILVVNGKDISDGNYVRIRTEKNDAEIPLLAILEELGAKITWKNEHIVSIRTLVDNIEINTLKWDFGILPPPGTYPVRKIVNNDLIIDEPAVSNFLKRLMSADIYADIDEMAIYVNNTKTNTKTGDGSVS